MVDVQKYNELRRRAERAKADADRAQGALDQQMKRLQEDFGCATVEEADSLLVQLQDEEKTAAEEYSKALAEFEEKWGSLL